MGRQGQGVAWPCQLFLSLLSTAAPVSHTYVQRKKLEIEIKGKVGWGWERP